jgi:broad specificity phosphatase PhoE
MQIMLIRHASTDTDGRLCGSFDVPLSRTGEVQLRKLVARVPKQAAPDVLFTSTLRRARQVAAVLGRDRGLQAAVQRLHLHSKKVRRHTPPA